MSVPTATYLHPVSPKATEAANESISLSLGYTSPIRVPEILFSSTSSQLPGGVRVVDPSGPAHQSLVPGGRDAGRNLGGSKGSSAKIPKAQCHLTPHSQRTRAIQHA